MASPSPVILIDVRTPAEFATGFLSFKDTKAINIEYQNIEQLPEIVSQLRSIIVKTSDTITLYCRSGRRSNIALQTLRALGYSRVRDIGGFDEAKAVLREEERQGSLQQGVPEVAGQIPERDDAVKMESRQNAFSTLLAGLKAVA